MQGASSCVFPCFSFLRQWILRISPGVEALALETTFMLARCASTFMKIASSGWLSKLWSLLGRPNY